MTSPQSGLPVPPSLLPGADAMIATHQLGEVVDARRCTVQIATGALFLDAIATPATNLLGHDQPSPVAVDDTGFLGLLGTLVKGYRCVAACSSHAEALAEARRLARRSVVLDASQGEPAAWPIDLNVIADESESLGRAGVWCASSKWHQRPDFIVIGDALAGGWPFGAVLSQIAWATPLAATPEATASRVAGIIEAVNAETLLGHGRRLGHYLVERLEATRQVLPEIADIEYQPLLARIRFQEPLHAADIVHKLCMRGVLATTDEDGRLVVAPPLPMRNAEIDVITGTLRAAILNLPMTRQSGCCLACDPEARATKSRGLF